MKESISNALLFTIIIVFVALIIVILVGSLAYSKSFKAKNRIIEILEKAYENGDNISDLSGDNKVRWEIEDLLSDSGYVVNSRGNECKVLTEQDRSDISINQKANSITDTTNYFYCIYPFETSRGPYYKVVVYMSFDFPIINSLLQFPVSGETKVMLQPISPNS